MQNEGNRPNPDESFIDESGPTSLGPDKKGEGKFTNQERDEHQEQVNRLEEVWNAETGDYASLQTSIGALLSQLKSISWPATADELMKHLESTGAIHQHDIASLSPQILFQDRKKSFSSLEEVESYIKAGLQKGSNHSL